MKNNFTKKLKIYLVICLKVIFLTACVDQTVAPPNFQDTVESHLQGVINRDMQIIEDTITTGQELSLIFPNGQRLTSRQEFLDFHREWFADSQWVYKASIESVFEGQETSVALVRYAYQNSPEEAARESWLVLTFQLQENQWRLVHDQNTSIQP